MEHVMTTKRIDTETQSCDLEARYRPIALKAVVAAYCIGSKIDQYKSRNREPRLFEFQFDRYSEQER